MKEFGLSYDARKALMVHVGEQAGEEIANLISQMASEIEELKRTKVSVTRIVPGVVSENSLYEFTEEPV